MGRIVPEDLVCCPECFADDWLKDYVKMHAHKEGTCDYCAAASVSLLDIEDLEGYFKNWLSMYTTTDHWSDPSLLDHAQGWEIFSEDLSEPRQAALLEDILNCRWDDDDGESPIDAQEAYAFTEGDEDDRWTEFCSLVSEELDPPVFEIAEGDSRRDLRAAAWEDAHLRMAVLVEDILHQAKIRLDVGTVLYRARLGANDSDGEEQAYTGADMGAPPVNRATAGRANTEGRRVLYCAQEELTAISEVRPAQGNVVSVCRIALRKSVQVLDLVTAWRPINPFESRWPAHEVTISDLLWRLGRDMCTPLRYSDDPAEYRDTQLLCEFFRKTGLEGMRYVSALRDPGLNVVLFDPDVAEVGVSRLVEVESVVVKCREIVGRRGRRRRI